MYIAKTDSWYLERIIWMIAGLIAIGSAVMAAVHSTYWLLLTGFMGVNLLIFGATGFCLMANILFKLGATPYLKK